MSGKHQSTNAHHLRTLVASGVDIATMANTFGVHKTAVTRWLKDNVAPKWTVPASKVFHNSSKKVLVVGIIDRDKWALVGAAITALGLESLGQRNI